MKWVKFRNQTPEEIIKHLAHLLAYDTNYNLTVDPLRIHFTIVESTRPRREFSEKRWQIRESQMGMSGRERRLMGTKRRRRPKIRSFKRGRTVDLKGRIY